MKIEKHWLVKDSPSEKVVKDPTPNYQYQIFPRYLILHYTAGDTADKAIDWFKSTPAQGNPDRICAQIVIGKDGTITQLAPFNTRCNHAGYSFWDAKEGMNEHSIGIEIVNPGYCQKMPDGSYRRVAGANKDKTPVYKKYDSSHKDQIVKLSHKHKFWTAADNQYWFKYTQAQIDAVIRLSRLLINTYHLSFVVGHDDVSVARKPDPGPAFPWDDFKLKVFGKTDNTGKIYVVQSADDIANFRTKPDVAAPVIKKLPNGYEVGVIETFGQWVEVYLVNDIKDVVKKVNGKSRSVKIEGWLHASLLKPKI